MLLIIQTPYPLQLVPVTKIKNTDKTDRCLELINFYSDMKKNNRSSGMRDPDGEKVIKMGSRFTDTAVPRFDGGGYWQQHL